MVFVKLFFFSFLFFSFSLVFIIEKSEIFVFSQMKKDLKIKEKHKKTHKHT